LSERALKILEFLTRQGASFQPAIHQAVGDGFPNDTMTALWELVWAGLITNDTYHPVRARIAAPKKSPRSSTHLAPGSPGFIRRQRARSGADGFRQGRWSLVQQRVPRQTTPTEWSAAVAQQMLVRNGIVMRETAAVENVRGGYSSVYPALKTMEESGLVRRGMFVAGMGAAQFAMPAAVDMLRSLRRPADRAEAVHLAASDPANPYGGLLPWSDASPEHSMARAAGANVVLVNGRLAAFFRRRNPAIRVFLPADEPELSETARQLAQKLAEVAIRWQSRRSGLLISTINDEPAAGHLLGYLLEESGFVSTAAGYQMRRIVTPGYSPAVAEEAPEEDDETDSDA
jgi:ATP-dependent Lhr-like helicase